MRVLQSTLSLSLPADRANKVIALSTEPNYYKACKHLTWSFHATAFTAKFIVAKVPFFKPTEKYLIDKEVTMKRRDLRGGAQTCTMRPVDRGLQVDIQWPEPCAGVALIPYTEFFMKLWTLNVLRVTAEVQIRRVEVPSAELYPRWA